MKKIFFYFLLASSILFSDSIKNDINVTKFEMDKIKLAEEDLRKEKIANYILELKEIEKKISLLLLLCL